MKEEYNENLSKRRQKSLSQLREGLGSPRQEISNTGIDALNQAREVLKTFSQEKKLEQNQDLISSDLDEKLTEGSVIDDLSIATPVADTIKQLHQQIRAKKALRQQLEENPNSEIDSSFSPAIQQQLVSQLLSSDFLKNTQLWLSSTAEPDKEATSTSLEELEGCQNQVKYRLKVLQILSQETQRELENLELQIRIAKGLFSQTNE